MAKRKAKSQTANLTPNQKKSGIDPIYLVVEGVRHTVGELQLCFKSHLDPRSACKVMGFQSRKSPNWSDFGTPTRKSQEREKPFGCRLHGQPQSIL